MASTVEPQSVTRRSKAPLVALGSALVAAAMLAAAVAAFGSLHRAFAYLRGGCILVEPSVLDLGDVPVGQEAAGALTLMNLTGRPIIVAGCHVTCACVAARGDLPVTIAPRASAQIRVRARIDSADEPFVQDLVFYTDCAQQPYVPARVVAHAVAPADDRAAK